MTLGDKLRFVARFGGVYERSPWVADRAFDRLQGVEGIEAIAGAMADCVDQAPFETQLELIRSHPDLADRTGIVGELTPESAAEQSSAGLDRCSSREYAHLAALTHSYRERFGFPFVMAVRGSDTTDILIALQNRLRNERSDEIKTALGEIHKIAQIRLQLLGEAP